MERMLGLFAHDLRAQLALARGWAETGTPGALERVQAALDDAMDIVEQGLLLADGARLRRQALDIWAVLDDVGGEYGVTVHRPRQERWIQGDPVAVRRICQNIISNAKTHGSGAIEGRVRPDGGLLIHDPEAGAPVDPEAGHGFGTEVVLWLARLQGWRAALVPGGVEVHMAEAPERPDAQG